MGWPDAARTIEQTMQLWCKVGYISDTGAMICFHGHYTLAKEIFAKHDILSPAEFAQVDWPKVNIALHGVPRCFQLWACKQVHNIAGTNQCLHKHGQVALHCVHPVWPYAMKRIGSSAFRCQQIISNLGWNHWEHVICWLCSLIVTAIRNVLVEQGIYFQSSWLVCRIRLVGNDSWKWWYKKSVGYRRLSVI